jgi:hypothetical protein
VASPVSSLSRSALQARDALVLQHLPLADAIASATAHRLFPLVERDDLLQVAREALVALDPPSAQRSSRQSPTCAAASAVPCTTTCAIGVRLVRHLPP